MEIVFDAYKRGRNDKHDSNLYAKKAGVKVIYTSVTETADMYIERRFQELNKKGFKNMIVCSDDNMLRSVAGSSK